MLVNELFRFGEIDLVGVFVQNGKIHHASLVHPGVDPDEIAERAHGLGTQMAAPAEMMVHDLAQTPGFGLAIEAVQVIHIGAEEDGVGHLAADDPRLHHGAAEEAHHLLAEPGFHLFDKGGSLVIEDLGVIQEIVMAVLGVAPARVGNGQEPDQRRGGLLRGDEVDGLLLPPDVIFQALLENVERGGFQGFFRSGFRGNRFFDVNGPGVGRGFGGEKALHHLGV